MPTRCWPAAQRGQHHAGDFNHSARDPLADFRLDAGVHLVSDGAADRVVGVLNAIRDTDRKLLEMARAFRFPFGKRCASCTRPRCSPRFSRPPRPGSALRGSPASRRRSPPPKQSVGYMLYESKLTLETADLFAWTLLVVLLSMLIEWLLARAMRRIRG